MTKENFRAHIKNQVYEVDSDQGATYDVSILYDLAPKARSIDINKFKHLLKEQVWGDKVPSLETVLRNKEGEEWDSVLKADLRFPIIATSEFTILDGNHRLLKALHLGKTEIKARIFEKDADLSPASV